MGPSYQQARREVQGALRQNIFKITAFEKIFCKSYLNVSRAVAKLSTMGEGAKRGQ